MGNDEGLPVINSKRFFIAYTPSVDVQFAVRRTSDGLFLQEADGEFEASISYIAMSEDMPGGYGWIEDRAVWGNGLYQLLFYTGIGFDPIPLSGSEFQIASDQIMNGVALAALSAKNAVSTINGALKIVNSAISDLAKKVSIITGVVNDISTLMRRRNGS